MATTTAEPSHHSAIQYCPHCGAEIPPAARFCGDCGRAIAAPTAHEPPVMAPNHRATSIGAPANPTAPSSAGGGSAGLISILLGVIGIFMCGPLTAFPGLYFAWSDIQQAKSNNASPAMGYVGLAVNALALLLTAFGFMVFGLMMMAGM